MTRKSRALVDLEVYQEAAHLYEIVKDKTEELKTDLSVIYRESGSIHESLEDIPGALACYNLSLEMLPDKITKDVSGRTIAMKAMTTLYKANMTSIMGKEEEANALFREAIDLANASDHKTCRKVLGVASMNIAISLSRAGKLEEALEAYDKAIKINKKVVGEHKLKDMINILLLCYTNKGVALKAHGQIDLSLQHFAKSQSLAEKLVHVDHQTEHEYHLAVIYLNQTGIYYRLKEDPVTALDYADKALKILEKYVVEEDRWEASSTLVHMYALKLEILRGQDKLNDALYLNSRSIDMVQTLIERSGGFDLIEYQVENYSHRGEIMMMMDHWEGALPAFTRCEELARRACEKLNIENCRWQMHMARGKMVVVLDKLGRHDEALELRPKAIKGLKTSVDMDNLDDWFTKKTIELIDQLESI